MTSPTTQRPKLPDEIFNCVRTDGSYSSLAREHSVDNRLKLAFGELLNAIKPQGAYNTQDESLAALRAKYQIYALHVSVTDGTAFFVYHDKDGKEHPVTMKVPKACQKVWKKFVDAFNGVNGTQNPSKLSDVSKVDQTKDSFKPDVVPTNSDGVYKYVEDKMKIQKPEAFTEKNPKTIERQKVLEEFQKQLEATIDETIDKLQADQQGRAQNEQNDIQKKIEKLQNLKEVTFKVKHEKELKLAFLVANLIEDVNDQTGFEEAKSLLMEALTKVKTKKDKNGYAMQILALLERSRGNVLKLIDPNYAYKSPALEKFLMDLVFDVIDREKSVDALQKSIEKFIRKELGNAKLDNEEIKEFVKILKGKLYNSRLRPQTNPAVMPLAAPPLAKPAESLVTVDDDNEVDDNEQNDSGGAIVGGSPEGDADPKPTQAPLIEDSQTSTPLVAPQPSVVAAQPSASVTSSSSTDPVPAQQLIPGQQPPSHALASSMELVPVKGDGACLFHSLAGAIESDPKALKIVQEKWKEMQKGKWFFLRKNFPETAEKFAEALRALTSEKMEKNKDKAVEDELGGKIFQAIQDFNDAEEKKLAESLRNLIGICEDPNMDQEAKNSANEEIRKAIEESDKRKIKTFEEYFNQSKNKHFFGDELQVYVMSLLFPGIQFKIFNFGKLNEPVVSYGQSGPVINLVYGRPLVPNGQQTAHYDYLQAVEKS